MFKSNRMFKRLLSAIISLAVISSFMTISTPRVKAAQAWNLTVDCSTETGQLNRVEKGKITFANFDGVTDTYVNKGGKLVHGYFGTNTNLETFIEGLQPQQKYFEEIDIAFQVNIKDLDTYEATLRDSMVALKQTFSKFVYAEIENEANLSITVDVLKDRYLRAINVVNYVNATVNNGPPIKIGPNFTNLKFTNGQNYSNSFLDWIQANGYKMDVYTFHTYSDSARMDLANNYVTSALSSRGLNPQLLVSEAGYTPGAYDIVDNYDAAKYGAHYAAMSTYFSSTNVTDVIHFTQLNQFSTRNSEYRAIPVTSNQTGSWETYDFTDTTGRYLMLNFPSKAVTASVCEVEIYGDNGKYTLTPGTFENLTELIDGDLNTYKDFPRSFFPTASFDLGAVQSINYIKIYWNNGGSNAYEFNCYTSADMNSWDQALGITLPTPVGNVTKLQTKLADKMVSVTGNSTDSAYKGVVGLATAEENKVAIMLSNFQDGGTQDYAVTLNINNLPSGFAGKSVRWEMYKVSPDYGNTFKDITKTEPELVEYGTKAPGNVTLWPYLGKEAVALIVLTPVVNDWTYVDDRNPGLTYFDNGGNWGQISDTGDNNSTMTQSEKSGAWLQYSFYGSEVGVAVRKGTYGGITDILVDDVVVGNDIDTYSDTRLYQQEIFTKTDLAQGWHTVRVYVTGQKNPSAVASQIMFDYIKFK